MSNEQKLKELTINQMHSIKEYQRQEVKYDKRIAELEKHARNGIEKMAVRYNVLATLTRHSKSVSNKSEYISNY